MYVSLDVNKNLSANDLSEQTLEDGHVCMVWAKGYFFDSTGTMRVDHEIIAWLAAKLSANRLSELVPQMNGCFSVVIVWPESKTIESGTDRYGTIPIYFYIGNRKLIVSDNFWQVAKFLSKPEYSADAILSMVILGYVTGFQTLLQKVKELPNASVHHISLAQNTLTLKSHRYWQSTHEPDHNVEDWQEIYAQLINDVFQRYSQAIIERDWNLHIPLSSGKDSRLLAGLFSRNGIPVHTFSYGPLGNSEMLYAAQVANALGAPIRLVSIHSPSCLQPALIQSMTKRIGMRARFTAGLGAQLSLHNSTGQDVYTLGHLGGVMPAFHESRGIVLVKSESQAIQQLINMHCLPVFNEIAKNLFPGIWNGASKQQIISRNWYFDTEDPLGSISRWEIDNRLRRLILSELSTYESFGHWILPFSDYKFFEFYTKIPLLLSHNLQLYIDTLINKIFINELAPLSQIPIAGKGILKTPKLSWRDWFIMRKPTAIFGSQILKRAKNSKRREHLQSIGARSPEPSSPDPLDYWWPDYPAFRQSIIGTLKNWDGMGGIIDVDALIHILQQPLPRLFIQFTIPALLTLCYFQKIVDREISTKNVR